MVELASSTGMTHKEQILAWWARPTMEQPYLVLPDGVFGGRVGEASFNVVTYVEQRPHRLILELEEKLMLTFTELRSIEAREGELIFSGFEQLIMDFQAWGAKSPCWGTVFNTGEARFVDQRDTGPSQKMRNLHPELFPPSS